ncbi:MAG: hypothetical protein ACE5E5_15900 [Phycisphaerae bacterium]
MLSAFVVYYRCKKPGDKKPGGVKQYRLYANSLEEARRLAVGYANYPDIEILNILRV